MSRSAIVLSAVVLLALAGCGGMTRTVGVLPATLDDLGARSEAFRGAPQTGLSSPAPIPPAN